MPPPRLHRSFRKIPRQRRKKHLAPNIFGLLVGKVEGPLDHRDDNHITIPIRIASGPASGLYRVPVTTASTGLFKDAQFCLRDQPIAPEELPAEGFYPEARLSYQALALTPADFTIAEEPELRATILSVLERAEFVAAYGITFTPFGLHDVHYNNGEPPGSYHRNRPDHDGALTTYRRDPATGELTRRWLFIKFQPQTLGSPAVTT